MTETSSPTVLVAVSSSPSGRAALRRAVAEAQHRGARLHLLRVWRDAERFASMTPAEVSALRQQERAEQAILAEAIGAAQSLAPGLEVDFEFVPGDLRSAVTAAAEEADLLVVGVGQQEPTGHLIAEWFEQHVPCPVLVTDPPIPVHAEPVLASAAC